MDGVLNFSEQVVVPPELGYGDTGAPPDIPPNAVLVFELDLVKIDQRTRSDLWYVSQTWNYGQKPNDLPWLTWDEERKAGE